MPPAGDRAAFLGGFVAAEGMFGRVANRFRFAVGLGGADAMTCEALSAFLQVGRITGSPRRRPQYDDEVTFTVQSLRQLVEVIVPFMDAHLPPSHKRTQYEAWRTALLGYWRDLAKRPRSCSSPDCEHPRRAHGLCRSHYFQRYHR